MPYDPLPPRRPPAPYPYPGPPAGPYPAFGPPPPPGAGAPGGPGALRDRTKLWSGLAVTFWTLAVLSVGFLVFWYLFLFVWAAASGAGGYWIGVGVRAAGLSVLGLAAVTAVAFLPPVRRLPRPARWALTGGLVAAAPVSLSVAVLFVLVTG